VGVLWDFFMFFLSLLFSDDVFQVDSLLQEDEVCESNPGSAVGARAFD
jgi:hypothetical protein